MRTFLKAGLCAGAIIGFVGLGACTEQQGEKLDSSIEKATKGEKDLGDGPLEKAGEAVDKATGNERNDAADALHDATDGDPKTKPN